VRSSPSTEGLRLELELRLNHGRCAYCGARGSPERALTREHLIPRSRGGGRHDTRIIAPACARCNHHRGCQELVRFLLARPRRISALVDHLSSLPDDMLRQLDLRIFGELCAALWLLSECTAAGTAARTVLKELCAGRTLHRRRYAARRVVAAVGERVARKREVEPSPPAIICRIPPPRTTIHPLGLAEPLERVEARLLELLAAIWRISATEVEEEIRRMLAKPLTLRCAGRADAWVTEAESNHTRRKPTTRLRVDRRRGRPSRRRAA
jgi:hypothetical protein